MIRDNIAPWSTTATTLCRWLVFFHYNPAGSFIQFVDGTRHVIARRVPQYETQTTVPHRRHRHPARTSAHHLKLCSKMHTRPCMPRRKPGAIGSSFSLPIRERWHGKVVLIGTSAVASKIAAIKPSKSRIFRPDTDWPLLVSAALQFFWSKRDRPQIALCRISCYRIACLKTDVYDPILTDLEG